MTEPSPGQPEVAQLLATLRAEVHARRTLLEPADQPEAGRALALALEEVEATRVVSAHWPLTWHNLPTRIVAGVQKIVRRGLRWYINPIVEQQNAYNATVADTLRLLVEAYSDLAAQLHALQPAPAWPGSPPPGPASAAPDYGAEPPATELIQAEIERRAAAEPAAALPELGLPIQQLLLVERQQVRAHWQLHNRGPLGPLATRVQQALRYGLRWLVNPVVEQQNTANAGIGRALAEVVALDARRRAQLARARARRNASNT